MIDVAGDSSVGVPVCMWFTIIICIIKSIQVTVIIM
jgi:hypothetical protein